MLNLLQCQGFAPWSANYQMSWRDNGKMAYMCDNFETQDLLLFQQFTSLIPVTHGASRSGVVTAIPEVTKTGVPLSTIIVAHHNLVTYGVPFETWTNPGPEKRFYSPTTAIPALANSTLFRKGGNKVVEEWLADADLEPGVTTDVPGMSKWVHVAKACFASPGTTPGCEDVLGAGYWRAWQEMHPNVYEDNVAADALASSR